MSATSSVTIASADVSRSAPKDGCERASDRAASVGVLDQLTDRLVDAVHLGLGRPHESRHRQLGAQRVHVSVVGHLQPIDAADVFTPAEDLANETFDGVERLLTFLIGLGRRLDRSTRIKQMQVHDGGNPAVIEIGPSARHGVLVAPETAEPVLDEVAKGGARLGEHKEDEREHRYTRAELEAGKTHDSYWNAAMAEMRETGYMHNTMRMYWGKQIIKWCKTPEYAYRTALHLNNKYFLDGRDPNSYANVAWLFGLHDRAWQERDVLGKIRTMTAGGLERKYDMQAYIDRIEGETGDRD